MVGNQLATGAPLTPLGFVINRLHVEENLCLPLALKHVLFTFTPKQPRHEMIVLLFELSISEDIALFFSL
jgi:hypothetical protein